MRNNRVMRESKQLRGVLGFKGAIKIAKLIERGGLDIHTMCEQDTSNLEFIKKIVEENNCKIVVNAITNNPLLHEDYYRSINESNDECFEGYIIIRNKKTGKEVTLNYIGDSFFYHQNEWNDREVEEYIYLD